MYSMHFIYLKSAVMHGGGSIMVWSCFAVSRPGQLTVTEGTKILEIFKNARVELCHLNINRS